MASDVVDSPGENGAYADATGGGGAPTREVSVRGLSYTYPGNAAPALSDVSLTFEQGKIYALLGRNGSGKSTLARCLNALLLPDGGTVLSCGLDTADPDNARPIRERLAMVFQNPDTQIVGITVEDEVAFGPENLGLTPAEIRERVDSAMALAGIAELADRNPLRMSQGQKQRVALAGALAMQPAFLISDESTSMLDNAARSRVLSLFMELRERDVGVVHVTHFLEEAAMADRVAVLEEGRLVVEGTPAQVLSDPERVRELGLDPLPVTVVADELGMLGHPVPDEVLSVKELMAWLSA